MKNRYVSIADGENLREATWQDMCDSNTNIIVL